MESGDETPGKIRKGVREGLAVMTELKAEVFIQAGLWKYPKCLKMCYIGGNP